MIENDDIPFHKLFSLREIELKGLDKIIEYEGGRIITYQKEKTRYIFKKGYRKRYELIQKYRKIL